MVAAQRKGLPFLHSFCNEQTVGYILHAPTFDVTNLQEQTHTSLAHVHRLVYWFRAATVSASDAAGAPIREEGH